MDKSALDDPVRFGSFIDSVDASLREQGIPIQARALLAHRAFSEKLGCPIVLNDPLSKQIFNWFDLRYGDRQKIDFSIGKSVIVMNGDPYEVKFPLIFGSVRANPLEWIKGVTPNLLQSLSSNDLNSACQKLISLFEAFKAIADFREHCGPDLAASVDHILAGSMQYGLSRWSSLQAAEKMLKALIRKAGAHPPNIHNLTELAKVAHGLGCPALEDNLIGRVQCAAGVRYGEIAVELDEAIDAHYASTMVCQKIGVTLAGMPG